MSSECHPSDDDTALEQGYSSFDITFLFLHTSTRLLQQSLAEQMYCTLQCDEIQGNNGTRELSTKCLLAPEEDDFC